MLYKTPDDTIRAVERFIRKGNYKKAFTSLVNLHKVFHDVEELIEDIVDLCINKWGKPEIAKPYLLKLIKQRSYCYDYITLSRVEIDMGHYSKAREYLKHAKELGKKDRLIKKGELKKLIKAEEDYIEYAERNYEWDKIPKPLTEDNLNMSLKVNKHADITPLKAKTDEKIQQPGTIMSLKKVNKSFPDKKEDEKEKKCKEYAVQMKILPTDKKVLDKFRTLPVTSLKEAMLMIDYAYLTVQSGFDEMISLDAIRGIEKYWYQIETAKKVLKYFHGRVLLCDEVGLGKTIEAGIIIKEYIMRGMAKNILILTPAPLVSQWKEEMSSKFGIEFSTTDNGGLSKDPEKFWKKRYVIASIGTARSRKNMPILIKEFYDIVVVDEAHHLRNRTTLSWKLVNQIKKRFIFLLSATPVQNNLIELYNLITLLKPGQFKTEKIFRQEYVQKGNIRRPANKEKLRVLLKDVMIRNTRSAIDLKLPKRFATTMRIEPSESEKRIYSGLMEYLRKSDLKINTINLLLREAGSSPFALKHSLQKFRDSIEIKELISIVESIEDITKGRSLIELLMKERAEKKIVFTQYLKSMDYITELLTKEGIDYVTFRGDMSAHAKNKSIDRFRDDVSVLVSTESGGEGRNLQFCRTIINFDLPWNPMRIEQRIGRLHRIGQTRDVFIFNLSVKGTIEDYIIDILDSKINMFEMVIGEIEPILGYISSDADFENVIIDIWSNSKSDSELEREFENLGNELTSAKKEYLKSKALDDEIFGEDYEI